MNNRHKLIIQKAQTEISKVYAQVRNAPFRQKYHFMPPAYWMNDPNGLIFYKNKYHLFYQHNPHSPFWNRIHWGHASSTDMLHWEHHPVALAPSETYDLDGCFSGSAIESNGNLTLFYTGVNKTAGEYIQSQCMAVSKDAIHFKKYAENPVVKKPCWIDSNDFRDPKVWKHNNIWYMIVGTSDNNIGKVLLYRSPDLKNWDFFNVMAESCGDLGYMWECPDFFEIEGKSVLLISPKGAQNRKSTYLIGDMDYKTGKFCYHTVGEMDWGFDFYAAQTFLKGERRIALGWANGWPGMPGWKNFGPTDRENWCGSMSLPREIRLHNVNCLRFSPIDEIKSLRFNERKYEDIIIHSGEKYRVEAGDGISCEIQIVVDLKRTDAKSVCIALRSSPEFETVIECNIEKGELVFDRNKSDGRGTGRCSCPLLLKGRDALTMQIFMDTCSVEVYADDGLAAMSNNIFPPKESADIYLFSKGGNGRIKKTVTWGIKSIW